MEYEFELRFKIPADSPDVERVVERLGEKRAVMTPWLVLANRDELR